MTKTYKNKLNNMDLVSKQSVYQKENKLFQKTIKMKHFLLCLVLVAVAF